MAPVMFECAAVYFPAEREHSSRLENISMYNVVRALDGQGLGVGFCWKHAEVRIEGQVVDVGGDLRKEW